MAQTEESRKIDAQIHELLAHKNLERAAALAVLHYRPFLIREMRKAGLSKDESEDATQLAIAEALQGHDRSRGNFRTFLSTIAYNKSIDELRRKYKLRRETELAKRLAAPEPQTFPSVDDVFGSEAEKLEALYLIESKLPLLPQKQREAIEIYKHEISKGKIPNKVRRAYCEAIRNLQAIINPKTIQFRIGEHREDSTEAI